MVSNVGSIDRVLRVLVGLLLLSLIVLLDGPARWWGLAGLVPLATGLMSYCPVYALLGVRTCAKDATGTPG